MRSVSGRCSHIIFTLFQARSAMVDNEERFAGAERREREASMCVCVREREVINKNQGYYWTLFFSVLPILPLSTRSTPTVKLPRNI